MTITPTLTRRLTGFTPSGRLHLGNLLGAMRPLIAAQSAADSGAADSIAFISDLHALTLEHNPQLVRRQSIEMATVLLAAGIDPDRTAMFLQSSIDEHTTLHYLLECATGYGEAARMIQFKERAGLLPAAEAPPRAENQRPSGAGLLPAAEAPPRAENQRPSGVGGPVRLSLLTYPVLMAADILLYDTDQVPVGDDQSQHLELARTIAVRFNRRYGETFRVPEGVLPDSAARVMNLADPAAKMSKSAAGDAGRIGLLDPPEKVRRTVARAVTDTVGLVRHDPSGQPGVTNLLGILAALGQPVGPFSSYGDLKRSVTDAVEAVLAPVRARYAELSADPGYVESVLVRGRDRVRPTAAETVRRARRAIGLLDLD